MFHGRSTKFLPNSSMAGQHILTLQFHDKSINSSFTVPWQVNKFLPYSSLAAQHIPSTVVPYFIVRDGAFSLLLTTWPPGKAPPDMGIILLNISWSPQLFQSPTPQMAVTTSPSHVTSHCKPTEINPIIVICWSSSQNTEQWLGVSRQVKKFILYFWRFFHDFL